jgi:hypothetical protein
MVHADAIAGRRILMTPIIARTFGLLALTLAALPAWAADPVFPLNSRLGLVPPAGFVASTKFPGFENPNANAAILMIALPAEAFSNLETGFKNDEALKQRGLTVESREPITLANGKGVLMSGTHEASGVKQRESVLLAEVAGLTALVTLRMSEDAQKAGVEAAVRQALTTITARDTIPDAEKLAVLPYRLADLAGFRIVVGAQDGTAILTEGAKDQATPVEQPFFIVGVKTGESPRAEERDTFARRIFSSTPGVKDVKFVSAEPLRIGGQQGHQIVADAKDAKSGADIRVVQWLRFGPNAHIQMFGFARQEIWEDVYKRFRTIRDGVELR